jgi:hypothetical protein
MAMSTVNTWGIVTTSQAFAPLVAAARGSIINIGSIARLTYPPYMGVYLMYSSDCIWYWLALPLVLYAPSNTANPYTKRKPPAQTRTVRGQNRDCHHRKRQEEPVCQCARKSPTRGCLVCRCVLVVIRRKTMHKIWLMTSCVEDAVTCNYRGKMSNLARRLTGYIPILMLVNGEQATCSLP